MKFLNDAYAWLVKVGQLAWDGVHAIIDNWGLYSKGEKVIIGLLLVAAFLFGMGFGYSAHARDAEPRPAMMYAHPSGKQVVKLYSGLCESKGALASMAYQNKFSTFKFVPKEFGPAEVIHDGVLYSGACWHLDGDQIIALLGEPCAPDATAADPKGCGARLVLPAEFFSEPPEGGAAVRWSGKTI